MSKAYDDYLNNHIINVKKAYEWIKKNTPGLLSTNNFEKSMQEELILNHDKSKSTNEEYDAYDNYFNGGNKSFDVVRKYNLAWLSHIHKNPHHWQHWVLINDDPEKGDVALDIPYEYIIEMFCDWWSFSWKNGNLYEIFDWYDEHRERMILSNYTENAVKIILTTIKKKLDSVGECTESNVNYVHIFE